MSRRGKRERCAIAGADDKDALSGLRYAKIGSIEDPPQHTVIRIRLPVDLLDTLE
jgi:hypothetical protein